MAERVYGAAMKDQDHPTRALHFLKMHGLGNDFVIVDARGAAGDPVTSARARAIGDRHRGIGFDQLAVIGDDDRGDARITFWNADGSLADACGNATRCVARLLMDETGRDRLVLVTGRGALVAEDAGGGLIRVNMGMPQLDWREIPLARDVDTLNLPIDGNPAAVGMGNPHCVFVVDDAEAVDLARIGPAIEHHPLFPQRTNVEFVELRGPAEVRARVWERGVGVTLACGSGACAIAVVMHRKGLTGRAITVQLDGGPLALDWRDDGVWMTGPTALVAEGTLTPAFLDGAR